MDLTLVCHEVESFCPEVQEVTRMRAMSPAFSVSTRFSEVEVEIPCFLSESTSLIRSMNKKMGFNLPNRMAET